MPQFDASGGSADAEGQPAPEPQPTNPPVDRVEQLSSEVARLQLVMSSMMALMESSPVFQSSLNSQTTQMAGAAMNPTSQPNLPVQSSSATEHPSHTAPPHLQHQSSLGQTVPEPAYRAPMDAEFDHLSRLEPLKIKDLWFAGDAAHLLSFLRTIRDFLRPRSSLFQTETRRVVWISRHFGYHPSEHRRTPSPVENWYNSLVIDNARRQGVFNMYADLDGQPFVHPTLVSVSAFLDGLIAVFGDKFMKENAKRALAACKQGKMTIGEYNSQFKSLVYLVENVEDARIEKYISGLNPRIIRKAMSKQWMEAKTLDSRMELASEAAAQLDLLALLPPEPPVGSHHHPLSSAQHQFTTPSTPRPPRDPDAMDVDATRVIPVNRSLLDFSRLLCRSRNLCFRCLSPIVPGTHTGSLNCPNAPVSVEKRQAFVDRCRQHPSPQVASISLTASPPPLSYRPTSSTSPLASSDTLPTIAPSSSAGVVGFDEVYDDYDESACATVDVPISTVQVRLDCSSGGRLLVPVSFKAPGGVLVPATVLIDTGAMANFVNESFIRQHDLRLRQRSSPVRCVGFDGREGVGGLVTQDWVGVIQLSTVDLKPFPLQSSFGVTRLGSVDAIFGLPWLDRQGWVASGSQRGGHCFTLGSTSFCVINSPSLGEGPEGKLSLIHI